MSNSLSDLALHSTVPVIPSFLPPLTTEPATERCSALRVNDGGDHQPHVDRCTTIFHAHAQHPHPLVGTLTNHRGNLPALEGAWSLHSRRGRTPPHHDTHQYNGGEEEQGPTGSLLLSDLISSST